MSSPNNHNNNNPCSQSTPTCRPNQHTVLSLKDRRKLKQRFRCTPWYNHEEFNHVGESLALATQLFTTPHPLPPTSLSSSKETNYCTSSESTTLMPNYWNEITYAIQRVSIWRKRNVNNRLPHYIEITSSLAQSLLQDAFHSLTHKINNDNGSSCSTNATRESNSTMTLRLSYASTIIRGVNGIADTMTRNRAMQIAEQKHQSLSVSNLCCKMGLPSWIVDIRHDSSHQELPSLTMLRLGALTLLQFHLDKYWLCGSSSNFTNVGNHVIAASNGKEWNEKGLEYLIQWKKSFSASNNTCSTTVASQDTNEKDLSENKKVEEDSKDDCNHDSGDNDSINFGKYSILMMESTFKKSRKKSNKEKTIIKKKDTKKKKKKLSITQSSSNTAISSSDLPQHKSAEQIMTNFLNDVPMDIAYDLLISYFIWGGVGDAPIGRGILIPGSIKSFAENLDGVRKLRQKYGQTLVQICKVWPGFIQCILVNIVDAILYLETEIDGTEASGTQDDENNEGTIPNENLSGIERKIYFLQSWAQYLVSNEFYYHLGRIDEATKISIESSKKTKQSKNKKNNPTPWSTEQLEIVESNASLSALKGANLPLSSLYDRVTGRSGLNSKLSSIVLLFESILNDNSKSCREKRMDIRKRNADIPWEQNASASKKQRQISHKIIEDPNEDMMSLEEMESIVMTEDDNHTHKVSTREVEAWTKCTTWDSCVIGSLPGYIS